MTAEIVKLPDEQILRNINHSIHAKNRTERRRLAAQEQARKEQDAIKVAAGKFDQIRGLDKLKVG
jgi:hypothetical protein